MSDKLIYSAIPAIIADVGPVGKNSKNQQQGYFYRSADDICNALHDSLGKHKVFATCAITDLVRSERQSKSGGAMQCVSIKCTYTFHAADGSSVSTEAIGDGMDSGDKATNKAMTAAYKYALIQVFAMMGHEDSEVDSPEPLPQTRHAANGHLGNRTNGHAPQPPAHEPTPWEYFATRVGELQAANPMAWPDRAAINKDMWRIVKECGYPVTDAFKATATDDQLRDVFERLEGMVGTGIPF